MTVQPKDRGSRFFQLAPAVLGLVGVVIGVAVTSGVTYLGRHSHSKAGERGAERLVLQEVLINRADLRSHARLRLADAAWRAEQNRLARSLSPVEWAWVAKYYRDLAEFRPEVRSAKSRLESDQACALIELNILSYSQSRYLKKLHKKGTCNDPPLRP